MTEDIPHDEEVADDEIPIVSEDAETYEVSEEGEVEEILDPLQEALQRAEKAEKEIAYKEAETQNPEIGQPPPDQHIEFLESPPSKRCNSNLLANLT